MILMASRCSASGPVYKSFNIEGDKVTISFDAIGQGLEARDGKALGGFELAGADKKFYPAEAIISRQPGGAANQPGNKTCGCSLCLGR